MVSCVTRIDSCNYQNRKWAELLLQGELYVRDGCCVCSCCCAKEFLIPKEFPIVLTMTRVQNSIAKKLPIFFFFVLTILESDKLITDNIYDLYTTGIIEINKLLVTSVFSY